jgi:hypothetical protein
MILNNKTFTDLGAEFQPKVLALLERSSEY